MKLAPKTKLLEKRIPTLLGLGILIAALAGGIFAIQFGTGVFAPRANPESTPKKVKITNVTDNSFTVSFVTDANTTGFLKYGTSPTSLKTTITDDRDQLAGNVGTYTTHHITVKSLQPETSYFFTLGTGNTNYDNNGQPYSIKTARKVSSSVAQTIYGTVLTQASTPAEGSIVYVAIDGASELSSLVRSSGTWAIPLSQARTPDGSKSPEIDGNTSMVLTVQGKSINETTQLTTVIGQPQLPIETITLAQGSQVASSPTPTTLPSETDVTPAFTATGSGEIVVSATATPSPTPEPEITITVTPEPTLTEEPEATATFTPTPTEQVILPATESAQPVSGNFASTLFLLTLGLSVTTLGSLLIFSTREQ